MVLGFLLETDRQERYQTVVEGIQLEKTLKHLISLWISNPQKSF